MKQNYRMSILLLAGLVFVFSCAKEQADNRKELASGNESEEVQAPAGKAVTVSALLADVVTKVSFDPSFDAVNDKKLESLSLCWESTDKLLVADHDNPGNAALFDLTDGEGTKKAVFSGTAPAGATSYDVSIVHGDITYGSQTQADDGDASHLQLIASKKNISDLSTITFDELNSVLAITALMPEGVAGGIRYVDITAMEADGQTPANIFGTGNSLTIRLDDNTGDDDYLHLFAALPAGDTEIPAGTTLLMHFGAPETAHEVYTRFVTLGSGLTFTAGKLNTINVNASQSDKHAGLPTSDGTSADKAYLIGDKYQMDYLHTAMTSGTTYVKMVDDVDLTGVSWVSLNNASGYDKAVNYDGNGKIISNLNAPLFDDLNGTVSGLTIDQATIDGGSIKTGILANSIKTAASYVNHVNIMNSSVTTTGSSGYSSGLICHITKGATISNVRVSLTNVTGYLVGGVLGFTEAATSLTKSSFIGNGTDSTVATKGVITANGPYAGGLIGSTQTDKPTIVDSCSVLSMKITSAYHRVGGAIGYLKTGSSISNSTVGSSSIPVYVVVTGTAAERSGGFIGEMGGGTVQNGKAYVILTGVKSKIGGFIGQMLGGEVRGCKSYGTVSGPSKIGGFFGEVTGATTITNNESYCSVTATSTYVGGFVGRLAGSVSCSDCSHRTGTVWSSQGGSLDSYVGGFAGYIGDTNEAFTGTVSHCYVSNTIVKGVKYKSDGVTAESSGKYVGGFAGEIGSGVVNDNTGLIEKCCVHASDKSGGQFTGGFAGVSNALVEKCRVSGAFDVTGYANYVGGFIAQQNGHHVQYCYSNAKLRHNDKKYVGGLIGHAANATNVDECYASGSITFTGSTSNNKGTNGGVIGISNQNSTYTKLIRWNDSNYANIVGGQTEIPSGCHVKTSSENNFLSVATSLGWSTDGTIWKYPSGGGIPSLVDVQ